MIDTNFRPNVRLFDDDGTDRGPHIAEGTGDGRFYTSEDVWFLGGRVITASEVREWGWIVLPYTNKE